MNLRYSGVLYFLLPLYALANAQDTGLPSDAGLPIVSWKDAPKFMDEEVIVQGRIVIAKSARNITFLNFDRARTFTAVVHERNYKNFPEPVHETYAHKIVRIRGVISAYQGKPQIEVAKPDQIRILEEELPIPPLPEKKVRTFNGMVTIASFNVLNLFDEHDDPYHADEGTDAKPAAELKTLAETIRKLDADVLALQEVENRGVLERFNAAMLRDLGYEHVVLFDGNDRRGIDVALLSRLPVGPVTSHRHLRFSDGSGAMMKFNRDLLQARIEPEGFAPFDVFVVHFKSKRGGASQTEAARVGEATQARKVMTDLLAKDSSAMFLICGDFNDTYDSKPLKVLRGEGEWALRDFLAEVPEGTASYNRMKSGGIIDFIMASPAMGETYVEKSYQIMVGTVQSLGSDHNPVVAKFELPARK